MMSYAETIAIIRKKVQARGYELEERKSTSTNSIYFKIYSGQYSLMFRVSDHATKSDVVTLRLDKKATKKTVEGFIANRCADLSSRVIKGCLGLK